MNKLGEALGVAAIILAILLGFGGCSYLFDKGQALRIQAEKQNNSPKPPEKKESND